MNHLDDGELRRMLDEPGEFGEPARAHYRACESCRSRGDAVRLDAERAARLFAGHSEPASAGAAYGRMRDRLAYPPSGARSWRSVAACAAAAAFVLALIVTPLGGYARSFLTIFEPRQFVPVEISRSELHDLRLLPQANDVGTQRVVRKLLRKEYHSFAAARRHAAFTLLSPATVPPRFHPDAYFTLAPGEMTFTFSGAKARAFERRAHKTLPPMPPALDGTTVRVQTGEVFASEYRRGSAFFEIVQANVPRITSTGASLDVLERYLLSMPNVSPQLAAQIRALGDIQTTVPVPVVIDKQTARRVNVSGTPGLAIGDNTGLGAGVMWQKNGRIYVVAGPVSMDEVTAVADGLR